jgi:thiaminase
MIDNIATGYKAHRLNIEDEYYQDEVAYALAITELIKYDNQFLDTVCAHPRGHLTEGESKVALTVLQWLGTPVGKGYLNKVKEIKKSINNTKNKEYKEWVKKYQCDLFN